VTAPDRAALGERAARALQSALGEDLRLVLERVTALLVAVQEEALGIEEVPSEDRIDVFQLRKQGGAWLGAARHWVQWNVAGGDQITWSSNTPLRSVTMREVEELASEVAAAEMNERAEALGRVSILRRRLLFAQAELSHAKEQLESIRARATESKTGG
jgi:endonuclease/exonuclease/phosphatase family metal-dependent hydrolase